MLDCRAALLALAAGAALLALAGRSALAEVAGLRITTDRRLDTSSVKRILEQIVKPGMSDREKALAIWRFATDYNYFYPTPYEPPGEGLFAYGVVTDVLKLINVYGYAYCFQHRSILEALWEAAGLEARTGGIGGHTIAEVFYDGQYHYLDSSQQAYCLMPDGRTIASRDQVADDPLARIVHQEHPSSPFLPGASTAVLPYEDKHILASYFFLRNFYLQHNKYRTGHAMNLLLPAAARMTWHFNGVGKWRQASPEGSFELKHFGHYNPYDGPAERHGRRTYANVVFRFHPDFKGAGEEFVEALSAAQNVDLNRGALIKPRPGPSWARLRVRLPYVICGWPTVLQPGGKPSGAAVISGRAQCLAGGGLRLTLSTDGGVTWTEVWRLGEPRYTDFALDVSPLVAGRYEFLLGIELTGRAGLARLEDLALDVNAQAAQRPLPALLPGRNRIHIGTGDGSKVMEFSRLFTSSADLKRYAHEVRNLKVGKWNVHPPTGETGEMTFRVVAPPKHDLAWLSVGGAMRTSVPPHPDETIEILVAAGRPETFRRVWQADVAPGTEHWCYEVDQRVDLPAGTRAAYVTYRITRMDEGAIGVPRIVTHYRRTAPQPPAAGLRVTYHWRENGEPKAHAQIVKTLPFTYTIMVPKDATVEMDRLVVEAVRPDRAPIGKPHAACTRRPSLTRREFADPVSVPALQEGLQRIRTTFNTATLLDVFRSTKSPVLRAQVVPVIGMLGARANPLLAERVLTDACGDKEKAVADRARKALVQFYRSLPDEAQLAALEHAKADRRALAAEVLGRRGVRAAADALAPLLTDRAGSVRTAAALALARLDDRRAVPVLARMMDRVTTPLSAEGEVTEKAPPRPFASLRAGLPFAVSLLALGDLRGDALIEQALTCRDRYVRHQAVVLLGEIAGGRAEPFLIRALDDPWPHCRRAAIVALPRHGTKAALPKLRTLAADDPVAWVKSEAAHAVRRLEARAGS